jgi:DNA-binding CsgD family transcriptional regulator
MRDRARPLLSLLDRRLEKPLIALQTALDGEALIKATFRVLKAAVRCDFANVCLRIVRDTERNVAYRMIDSRGFEYRRDLMEKEFFRNHPAMPTLLANPGIQFINTREILAPEKKLKKTRFYREVMQVIGFRHAVGMVFWKIPPEAPEAIFSLCREEGAPDFEDAEVAFLDLLYPHINAALRRLHALEKERVARDELRGLLRDGTRSACILDWDLGVAEANRAARESCAQWEFGVEGAKLKPPPFRLPSSLRRACLELKEHWHASLKRRPVAGLAEQTEVRHPSNPFLRAMVSMHPRHSDPLGKPGFLIEFTPSEPLSLSKPGKGKESFGMLTSQERKLVRLVCEGKSNQEIASATGRALGSIKNSLHTIFGKLGVRSRGALIACVQRTLGAS